MHFIEKISGLTLLLNIFSKFLVPNEYLLMKTNTINDFSCAVFGHNLERLSKDSQELTCKTCKTKITMDNSDVFEALPLKNENIKTALRELFLIQNRYSRQKISA
ncbi:MAG: hypothetical protein KDD05_04020 [Psychroserpens sp.]|nr:hypothetical protein [Psychroserpens sp.]